MQREESIQEVVEDESTISEIADEVGLSSEEGEEMLREAFDMMEIDEEFRNPEFSVQDSPYNYSITEHIKSTASVLTSERRYPSHGKVSSVDYEDGSLLLEIKTIGYNNTFTAEFNVSPDDENPPEKLAYLYNYSNATLYEPSSIVGKTVPVTYDNDYKIHYPPENPGLFSLIQYKIIRTFRRHNMVKIKSGSNGLTKTGWGYLVLFSTFLSLGAFVVGLPLAWFSIFLVCITFFGYIRTAVFD